MKKNLTELVFILDRSGSMAGLEKDTIGGFNSMIARQKAAEGEALVSTVFPLSHKSSVTSPPSLNTGKFRPIRFSGYSDSSFL